MAAWWWFIGAAGAALVVWVVVTYNRLVVLRNRCREAWANVDTELQRRHDLVPNLVRAVQGYMKHERELLQEVTRVRAQAARYKGDPHGLSRLERRLAAGLDRLLMVAEGYPRLKASYNFLQLQHELAITEDRIQAARRFYNGNVRDYHNRTRSFPTFILAPILGFHDRQYFQVESVHMRMAPKVRVVA